MWAAAQENVIHIYNEISEIWAQFETFLKSSETLQNSTDSFF